MKNTNAVLRRQKKQKKPDLLFQVQKKDRQKYKLQGLTFKPQMESQWESISIWESSL